MRALTLLILLLAIAGAIMASITLSTPAQDEAQPARPGIRFAAIDIFIDSGEAPLAAYQLEFRSTRGEVKIVGIGNGEHAAFDHPPYYDTRAMQQERVKIGDFSLNEPDNLPTGRTRITTIHLHITGDVEPQFTLSLDAAATVDGTPIDAKASFSLREEPKK